jgi:hypothetical protein
MVANSGSGAVVAWLWRKEDQYMTSLRAGVVLALALAGCSGSMASTPPSTQPAPTVSPTGVATIEPTPSATPEPTPAPTVDLKAAAATAYLAAVTKYNAALKANVAACNRNTLASQKKCLKTYYTAIEALDLAIRAIVFPSDTTADAHNAIRLNSSLDALVRQAYGSGSLSQINSYYWPKIDTAGTAASQASNLLRGDLGLPPVPVKL